MPLLGFGVYQIHGPAVGPACEAALAAGYRHVDTAQLYCNEAEVGAAVVRVLSGGVPRADVFVTTKIRHSARSGEATYRRARASVGRVDQRGVDGDGDGEGDGEGEGGYVDLFLVHMPWGGRRERRLMWLALEKLFEEGRARAIGVSNYEIEHIEDMRGYAKVLALTTTNPKQLHPWKQQRELVAYCRKHGIVVQAYSPLARAGKMEDPTLVAVAEKYGKTPAQILIRYSLQKGWVPLPKSERPERIRENAMVYDFEISDEAMETLDALDEQD
ncbi:NADP-dependent oxidoreductase domain-containing protein [Phialemonium atrogriseum]|uniref:NADP-dependent oxidoreductase domain-containing protein n=1 Tax=Phialemonium atrogriseum TaxID=1093897 RepID=A0AAJ0BWL6_9PEZI|nr:NADP-dependent oxidoreductase domain-containing protein [Phialemonium atrogriseum]KAK1765819.1 NADP-dependent oxidoreductase domain-containing protein [Phialemonium atrogriseum]